MIANRSRRVAGLVLAVGGVVATGTTVAACSSGASANGSLSADTLNSTAVQNAESAGWVHEEVVSAASGHTVSMTNDIGTSEGRQVISPEGAHATVLVVAGEAYIQGDSAALANYFGFPSSASAQMAGKWISFQSTDSGFSTISSAVTLKSDFSQIELSGPLTKGPVTELDGQRVIPIHGTEAAPGGEASVSATLYVADQGRILPVELQASGQGATETVIWSNWGQAVNLVAPSDAVPVSSISGNSTS